MVQEKDEHMQIVFNKTTTKVYDTNVFAQITATILTHLYVGLFYRYYANYSLLFVKYCIGSQCYAVDTNAKGSSTTT